MIKTMTPPRHFTRDDVEIIQRETCYRGFLQLDKLHFKHRLFSGAMSGVVQREVMKRKNAVAVLPWDPVRDEVVLIQQLRIAVMDSGVNPWQLEIIAGMIEQDEQQEAVARRESKEEAGIMLGDIHKVLSYFSSPGALNERITVFIAEVDATQASGVHGLAEENEDILVLVMSRQHAFELLEQGRIDNAASVIALQWLALNFTELKAEWEKR